MFSDDNKVLLAENIWRFEYIVFKNFFGITIINGEIFFFNSLLDSWEISIWEKKGEEGKKKNLNLNKGEF